LTTAADQPEDGARDGCYQEEAGSGACGGHDHLLKVNLLLTSERKLIFAHVMKNFSSFRF